MSGIPTELLFDLPATMLDSRKIEQRIQPYSQSQYTTAGQIAKFTIPQTDRTLVYGQTMYVVGNLDITGTSLGIAGTDTAAILGSFYSLFSRQVVNANGQVLETIERPGELVNQLISMTMNASEKVSQGLSLGTAPQISSNNNAVDGTGNISYMINADASTNPNGNKTIAFAIPIIGIFDANKYIPMWNSNIDLELTVNALPNWLTLVNGNTTAQATTSAYQTFIAGLTFTMYNLELVFDSIELSPESYNVVMANFPQQLRIKTQSYVSGFAGNVSGAGAIDIPINVRLASMKQLFFYFNQANLADQTFGGVNPNGTDVVFITNGQYYPQRPIKLTNPSEIYMQQQKAFGSIKTYSHSGSAGINELRRRNKANNYYLAPLTDKTKLDNYGNKFYLAIDTEKINTNKNTLYNGIATGVNSNIRLNIADAIVASDGASAYTMNCLYWCCYDVLLNMDFTTGITTAIY